MIEEIDRETLEKSCVAPVKQYWIIEWRNDEFYYDTVFVYREYKGHYYNNYSMPDLTSYRTDDLEDFEVVYSVGGWEKALQLQQRKHKLKML